MKLFSWNVNGIRAVLKKGALQTFIENYNPDILCLQETKAEKLETPIDFAQYKEYWNSAKRKGYSGTALFTKREPLNVFYNLPAEIAHNYRLDDGYGNTQEEGRIIAAEFPDYYVVTVYTPNAKDDLSRIPMRHKAWDPAFKEYMLKLNTHKPVIICGDFNVAHTELDLARPKENEGKKGFTLEEREGFSALLAAGFTDTLRLFKEGSGYYTWWSHWGGARERNVGWRIDYFLVSNRIKDRVVAADIHPNVLGSDHCPVSIELTED